MFHRDGANGGLPGRWCDFAAILAHGLTDREMWPMKYMKKFTAALVLCAILFCDLMSIHAQETSEKVVRVGFPIQPGMSYIDENGNYAGYMVDYLNQLTLFTDWKIEYVQAEGDLNTQLSTLLQMLQDGEIDMMGTMNRTAALEEMYLYPNYSYGSTHTVLAVRDDSSYISEDFSQWDGITVASYPGLSARMKQLEQYAQINGFTYQVVNYDTYDQVIDAVFNGEVDAVPQVDISLPEGWRSIGRFSPSPYYFALAPGRQDLLPELNNALEIVTTSYKNLQDELYERYFLDMDFFRLSKEEEEYIQSLGSLRVLFFTGNAPFQYIHDDQLIGFAVEYFSGFAESVGLQYQAVVEDDLEDAVELVQNGQVDLIACIATDSPLAYEDGIRLSLPYFNSYAILTYSEEHDATDQCSLNADMNTEEALEDILSDNCSAWIDGYSLNYYLRKKAVYDHIVTDWADTKDFSYAVAVTNTIPNANMMVSLLNQYASSLPDEDIQARLSTYLLDRVEYTPIEWLLANRAAIVVTVVSLLFVIVGFLFYNYRKKMEYKNLVNENKLLHLSIYDELTGAYNRGYFYKLMEQKAKQPESGALVALNVRNFKYINDTYGMQRADQLLCKIKEILDANLREKELLCRPTADCFYLFILESQPLDIQRRINSLQAHLKIMAEDFLDGYRISFYCGAVSSTTSPDVTNIQSNLNSLVVALSHARQTGDSAVCIYDKEMHKEEQLRQYIEANMIRALEENEYQVYLQPKMNLRTGKIDSAEALVRWQTKERGLLFPNQFIPLFEQNGFCKQLDLYMLEKVCQLLRSWMDQGIAPITISINQTKSLFVSDDYVEKLLEITSRYEVSPQYIVLEILEGLAFENLAQLNDTISLLNRAGFRVSMDDFGSGYSSLNTLGKLHVDQIKLDRMFLMDLRREQRSSQYEVMSLIFALAKKLGTETVTEGVETKEDEDLILSMGCDYGQGYCYSKPIPADDFLTAFLKNNE